MKNMIAVMLIFAILFAFALTSCDDGDISELDKPIGSDTSEIDVENTSRNKQPEIGYYTVNMSEKPEVTMWEFTYGADKNGKIKLADLSDNDIQSDCHVYMYRKESNIQPVYRYFIEIQNEANHIDGIKNYIIEVTEDNIDEVWLTIEASVLVYNNIAEQTNADVLEYDMKSWESLYDQIIAGLDEYQTRGFVVTEMIVGAAMDDNDWLSEFLNARLDSYV